MNINLRESCVAGRRFILVILLVAGIILAALLVELYIGMNLIHVPFLPPEDTLLIRDTLTAVVRLTGLALAVIYGVTALR